MLLDDGSVATQQLDKHVSAATNTHAKVEGTVGRVVFYMAGVVSSENLYVCLCILPYRY
jgi:hypothetical protein